MSQKMYILPLLQHPSTYILLSFSVQGNFVSSSWLLLTFCSSYQLFWGPLHFLLFALCFHFPADLHVRSFQPFSSSFLSFLVSAPTHVKHLNVAKKVYLYRSSRSTETNYKQFTKKKLLQKIYKNCRNVRELNESCDLETSHRRTGNLNLNG